MKRLVAHIHPKKHPEHQASGYVLVNELGASVFSFFCTEKFPIDEELVLQFTLAGREQEYEVSMSHLHEQISSGRIMTAVPTEDNPFPVRKFYRCFGKILKAPGQEQSAPELQAVPDLPKEAAPVEPTVETKAA